MSLSIARVVASLLLLAAGAMPATAQEIPGWETRQFTFERLDADRVLLVNQVEIVGTGPNVGNQIFAESVEWNITTGDFTASGNVLIVSPTSRLSAERVEFNTKTGLGTFHTASGIASLGAGGVRDKSMFGALEPDVYFYGERIDKLGEDKYRISSGGFTTCVQPTPRWEIVTGSATINLGDYAILRNAVIRVKDVPVFYLPVMYYPIQEDDRATGFLLPTYGNSSYRGRSLSNAFFWAMNRSQDVTLMHDWYFSKGQGGGADYRYAASALSSGNFRAYVLNEQPSSIETLTGTITSPARRSYELRGGVAHVLPGDIRARGTIDYFSDITVQQLYHNDMYTMSRRQRQYGGTLSGGFGGLTFTGTYQNYQLFYSETDSITSGYAPQAAVTLGSRRLGRAPIFVAAQTEAGRSLYIVDQGDILDDRSTGRFDVQPSIRAALSTLPFLNITGSFRFRYTYFTDSLTDRGVQVPVPLHRKHAEMQLDLLGPIVSRVYTPQNAFADRLKHIIEPNLTIERITSIPNQQNVVLNGSSYDFVYGGVTRMNYGLTNRIMVRKAPADPAAKASTSAPRELLAVTLTQSYYTDEGASIYDRNFSSSYAVRPPSNFSPVALIVRTTPTPMTAGTLRFEYDHEKGFVQGIVSSFSVTHPTTQVSFNWSKRRQTALFSDNALSASTTLNFNGGRQGGTYYLSWDIGRGTILQQKWVGFFNGQCCGVAIEYQEYNFPSFDARFPIATDRRFNLSFTLAGIGSFSNFFGTFGGGRY